MGVDASRTSAGPVSVVIRNASPSMSGQPDGAPTDRENRALSGSLPGESNHGIPLPVLPGSLWAVPVRATPEGCGAQGLKCLEHGGEREAGGTA